jgi:pimeloyl-ACP methyl ester carboxylesterase
MRVNWPGHLRTVELSHSTKVNYVEMGEGPPVLLIHGLGGAWQNWLENIPVLARNHRVIALDLPGFGDSPMPKWTINIRNYGSMMLDFIAALETGPLPVVGNSMGGFVAAEMSIRDEPAITKVVLASSAGVTHARMYKAPTATVARMAMAVAPMMFRYHHAALYRPRLRKMVLSQLFRDPAALRPELLGEFIRTGVNPPGFGDALTGLAGYDILDRLREVEDPVLIVWGRQDMIVPSADALAFSEMLSNSRVEIFNYCGHIPMAERPVRFNRVLEEFLAE